MFYHVLSAIFTNGCCFRTLKDLAVETGIILMSFKRGKDRLFATRDRRTYICSIAEIGDFNFH